MDDDNLITEGRKSEEQLVEEWRIEQFLRLGFSKPQVLRLYRTDADLNVARELIAAGCDRFVAEMILV